MRILLTTLLALTLLLGAFQPTSAKTVSLVPYRPPVGNHPIVTTYPFEFHSGFWINLYHFLYEQALERKRGSALAQSSKDHLTPEQQQVWNAALDYYANTIIKRDLLSDDELIKINDDLSAAEDSSDLKQLRLNSDLRNILTSVAAIYRSRWWPDHDRANRFWIAVVTPLVKEFQESLIKQLTDAYRGKWPSSLIRVDVVEYANWAGAYTTFDQQNVHVTVATDPNQQGFVSLELLFHESSHWMVGPRTGAVATAIARECKAKNKPIPGGLWHAIIFYTAGEFVKRDLSERRVTDYTPMGYRGLYARAWPKLQRPLELYWQPYLEDKVDFDTAIQNLISAL